MQARTSSHSARGRAVAQERGARQALWDCVEASTARKCQCNAKIVEAVMKAQADGNWAAAESILVQTFHSLRQRSVDRARYECVALLYLAKVQPALFARKNLVKHLTALLGRDSAPLFKRTNNTLQVMACALLMGAFREHTQWPAEFCHSYLEDAVHERTWVDDPDNQIFVDNILTFLPKTRARASGTVTGVEIFASYEKRQGQEPTVDRFTDITQREMARESAVACLRKYTETVRDAPRNIIKGFITTVTLPQSRALGSAHLDEWLNNPSTMRFAKLYLSRIAEECDGESEHDFKTLEHLLLLKTKSMFQPLLLEALSALFAANKEFGSYALNKYIQGEMLSSTTSAPVKAPNMKLLALVWDAVPDNKGTELSFVFQEMAANDSVKGFLGSILRKFVRLFPDDLDLYEFAKGLLAEQSGMLGVSQVQKNGWLAHLGELVCLAQMLHVQRHVLPQQGQHRSERRRNSALMRLADFQRDAMVWLCSVVPAYSPPPELYMVLLRKLLWMEPFPSYSAAAPPPPSQSNTPVAEADLKSYNVLVNEGALHHITITRIVVMALKETLPLQPASALDILQRLVLRAVHTQQLFKASSGEGAGTQQQEEGNNVVDAQEHLCNALLVENTQLADAILKLSLYKPPNMPKDVRAAFAVVLWLWKASALLLLLAAYNPVTIGEYVWREMPMARTLMEMCITENYAFPPLGLQQTPEEIAKQDRSREDETAEILILEQQLAAEAAEQKGEAAPTITAENSLLIGQLMLFNTAQLPRDPPPDSIVQTVRGVNTEFRLGHSLCACRHPDFLLETMEKQGHLNALKWLLPVVDKDTAILPTLPVFCLCEILVQYCAPLKGEKVALKTINSVLRELLRPLLGGAEKAPSRNLCFKVLTGYLASDSAAAAKRALSTLHLAYTRAQQQQQQQQQEEEEAAQTTAEEGPLPPQPALIEGRRELESTNYGWTQLLPGIGEAKRRAVVHNLLSALHWEVDPSAFAAYLQYLMVAVQNDKIQARELSNTVAVALTSSQFACRRILGDQDNYSLIIDLICNSMEVIIKQSKAEKGEKPPNLVKFRSKRRAFELPAEMFSLCILLLKTQTLNARYRPHRERLAQLIFPDGDYLVSAQTLQPLLDDSAALQLVETDITRLADASLGALSVLQQMRVLVRRLALAPDTLRLLWVRWEGQPEAVRVALRETGLAKDVQNAAATFTALGCGPSQELRTLIDGERCLQQHDFKGKDSAESMEVSPPSRSVLVLERGNRTELRRQLEHQISGAQKFLMSANMRSLAYVSLSSLSGSLREAESSAKELKQRLNLASCTRCRAEDVLLYHTLVAGQPSSALAAALEVELRTLLLSKEHEEPLQRRSLDCCAADPKVYEEEKESEKAFVRSICRAHHSPTEVSRLLRSQSANRSTPRALRALQAQMFCKRTWPHMLFGLMNELGAAACTEGVLRDGILWISPSALDAVAWVPHLDALVQRHNAPPAPCVRWLLQEALTAASWETRTNLCGSLLRSRACSSTTGSDRDIEPLLALDYLQAMTTNGELLWRSFVDVSAVAVLSRLLLSAARAHPPATIFSSFAPTLLAAIRVDKETLLPSAEAEAHAAQTQGEGSGAQLSAVLCSARGKACAVRRCGETTDWRWSSHIDLRLHRAVKVMMDATMGADASAFLYAVACDAPELLYPHLPAMAVMLRGRTHLSSRQFFERQFDLLFERVLLIMHAIGAPLYTSALADEVAERAVEILGVAYPRADEAARLLAVSIGFLEDFARVNALPLLKVRDALLVVRAALPQHRGLMRVVDVLLSPHTGALLPHHTQPRHAQRLTMAHRLTLRRAAAVTLLPQPLREEAEEALNALFEASPLQLQTAAAELEALLCGGDGALRRRCLQLLCSALPLPHVLRCATIRGWLRAAASPDRGARADSREFALVLFMHSGAQRRDMLRALFAMGTEGEATMCAVLSKCVALQ